VAVILLHEHDVVFVWTAYCIQIVKVKGEVVLCLTKHHAMKTCWGSGGIALCILLHQHKVEVSGQLHALAALPPVKEPLVFIG
jgi:hypothetical protein